MPFFFTSNSYGTSIIAAVIFSLLSYPVVLYLLSLLNNAFTMNDEKQSSGIEEKKELILAISHELGTPLSRIQVAVEIIREDLEMGGKPSDKILDKLSKSVNEISTLLKELLELGRLDKTDVLNKDKTDIEQLINNSIEKLQVFIEEKNLNVKVNSQGNIKEVMADRVKIERVIKNLLANAIDYTPKSSEIIMTVKENEKSLYFSIKDNGPGISEENKEKIFEPFFRVDPSRTRKTGGTGLGLAIVKKIINLHGGKIWVENPGKKGAVIAFEI